MNAYHRYDTVLYVETKVCLWRDEMGPLRNVLALTIYATLPMLGAMGLDGPDQAPPLSIGVEGVWS